MRVFGLDLGTNSIKAVELKPVRDKYQLLHFGLAPMPASLQSEAETDQQAIAAAIKKLLAQSGIKLATPVLALPEAQVFSRVIEMAPLSEAELKSAIRWEAEQYVPIPLDEASLDYQIVKPVVKKEDKMEVFLIAAPKNLINRYLKILKLAGLQPAALETELVAISRALVNADNGNHLIISIGSQSSDLAIIHDQQIVYTRSISTGGQALGRAVAKALNLDLAQAEEYKKSYGLLEDKLEGKVRAALKPVFDTIIEEIKKAVLFYQEKSGVKLTNAILAGGTIKLPEAVSYLASALDLEVAVGDPMKSLVFDQKQVNFSLDDGPLYTTAIGLAMKKV